MPTPVGYIPQRCGALLVQREGETERRYCNRWAIRGGTRCHRHGGNFPTVREGARRKVRDGLLQRAVVIYGLPVDVSPHEALLEEIQRTAGHVRWLENVIANFDDHQDLVWGKTETTARSSIEDMQNWDEAKYNAVENMWLKLYFRERKHLADISAKAISLGIAEAQVRIHANMAAAFEAAMLGVLADVGADVTAAPIRASISKRMLEASAALNGQPRVALDSA